MSNVGWSPGRGYGGDMEGRKTLIMKKIKNKK